MMNLIEYANNTGKQISLGRPLTAKEKAKRKKAKKVVKESRRANRK